MISFDTNVLVYATATASDARVSRARDLLVRAMQVTHAVFLLQSLAEFSSVAVREAGIPVENVARIITAWCAVLPIQSPDESDLLLALDVVRAHRLAFWDAMLWASAQRAGVRQLDVRRGPAVHLFADVVRVIEQATEARLRFELGAVRHVDDMR